MPTQTWQFYAWGLQLTWLFFVFAFGACIGSLVNVLVYRLPRGIGVVTPPSACPKCNTQLTFRENLPIIGWLLLKGRCRYCREKVSPEYPIVEAAVAVLFAAFYVLWFVLPGEFPRGGAVFLGIDWSRIRPEWALNSLPVSVPLFVMTLLLLGSLVAMTIVDAKTFTIPLVLTWVPAIVGLLVHVGTAVYVEHWMIGGRLRSVAPAFNWALPTPVDVVRDPRGWVGGWGGLYATVGAMIGLGIGMILLWTGLVRRSFLDYAEWEKRALPDAGASEVQAGTPAPAESATERPADVWIQYPHARREMIKELAFLAPCVALGLLGWYAANWWGPTTPAPLWVTVLAGVLLGYLVGGGVVWGVRVLGSLGFGKEAMGLGDVHLMAGVGVCLGWIDATLAFFLAAFVGLVITAVQLAFGGGAKRTMPYGPSLAIATVLVLLTKPAIEAGLACLLGHPVNIP